MIPLEYEQFIFGMSFWLWYSFPGMTSIKHKTWVYAVKYEVTQIGFYFLLAVVQNSFLK